MGEQKPQSQLQMIWPARLLAAPPTPTVPEGYALRTYRDTDASGYLFLMAKAGFEGWDGKRLSDTLQTVLPDGFFVMEHLETHTIVASAMAQHHATALHPFGGELGWVAGDAAHKGKGLGLAVCAAATARLIRAGYTNIYLITDDHRLPAIKIYLRLGYEPFIVEEGMVERWQRVCQQLGLQTPKDGFASPAA